MAIVIGAGVVLAVVLLAVVLRRASEHEDPLGGNPAAALSGSPKPHSPIEGDPSVGSERSGATVPPSRSGAIAAPGSRTVTFEREYRYEVQRPARPGETMPQPVVVREVTNTFPTDDAVAAPVLERAAEAAVDEVQRALSEQLGPVVPAETTEEVGSPSGAPLSVALRDVTLPEHLAPVTSSLDPAEWERRFVLASEEPLEQVRRDLERAFTEAGYEARWLGEERANFVRPGRGVCATIRPPMDEKGWVEHKLQTDLPKTVGKAALWVLMKGPDEWDPFPRQQMDPRLRPVGRADFPTVKLGSVVVELTAI